MRGRETLRLILHFPTSVELLMDITQALVGDMRIDLSSSDILVAQEFLNAAQIRSMGK